MQTRIADLTHVGTLALGRMHAALFELMRGDRKRAAPSTFELARLAREHGLPMWDSFGLFLEGWLTSSSGAIGVGLKDMRRGVEQLGQQNVLFFDGLLKIALAEAEAAAGDLDRALAVLNEGLATAERTGFRAYEAELHRARGQLLLQRDPANSVSAEDAFLTATAVAKQQGTRSFGCARRWRWPNSINRPPAPRRRTRRSLPRSMALRRLRKCPRSPRRRRCLRR